MVSCHPNMHTSSYTRALEERIASLESQLESRPDQDPSIDHNPIGELVGFLALNSSEAPAYVGSSSGLSLAANLGEMVQATVWNQVLAPSRGGSKGPTAGHGLPPQPSTSTARGTASGDRPRPLRMEELFAKGTEPPNDEMGAQFLRAYLTRLHVRYPFLDRRELWRLHEDRWRLAGARWEDLLRVERFGIFKLYVVYAIGATTIQLSGGYSYVSPEVSFSLIPPLFTTDKLAILHHRPAAGSSHV